MSEVGHFPAFNEENLKITIVINNSCDKIFKFKVLSNLNFLRLPRNIGKEFKNCTDRMRFVTISYGGHMQQITFKT